MKKSELFKILLEDSAVAAIIDKAASYEAVGKIVADVMTAVAPVFDTAYCGGYDEGYDRGYDKGYEEGRNDGYSEGYNDGLDEKIY